MFNAFWDSLVYCVKWWRDNKNSPVALKKCVFVVATVSVISFLIGQGLPEEDYTRLESRISTLRGDVRDFAETREKTHDEIRRLRLTGQLNEQLSRRLSDRIEELTAENLRRREEALFYRRTLGAESQASLNVYALEETPDFRPGYRRLSAVLIYPQTEFTGGYYFEAVVAQGEERTVQRTPKKGILPLELDVYAEVEQVMELPTESYIAKLRLVVEDENGEVIAEAEINADSEDL